MSGTETVKITTARMTDTLSVVVTGVDRTRAPRRVRGGLLVPVAQSVLQETGPDVASTQIVKRARIDSRLSIKRNQAWRAKQHVLSASNEDGDKSYQFMRDWLERVKDQNPAQ